jgi:hypothetical protein
MAASTSRARLRVRRQDLERRRGLVGVFVVFPGRAAFDLAWTTDTTLAMGRLIP